MFAALDDDEEIDKRLRAEVVGQIHAAAADVAAETIDEAIQQVDIQQVACLSAAMIGEARGMASRRLDEIEKPDFERIKLTKAVTEWLDGSGRGNDAKLRHIFRQRLTQLAAGDQSRILQKRLTGARNMSIYETYMDGNFRILWTEDTQSETVSLGLVIW